MAKPETNRGVPARPGFLMRKLGRSIPSVHRSIACTIVHWSGVQFLILHSPLLWGYIFTHIAIMCVYHYTSEKDIFLWTGLEALLR